MHSSDDRQQQQNEKVHAGNDVVQHQHQHQQQQNKVSSPSVRVALEATAVAVAVGRGGSVTAPTPPALSPRPPIGYTPPPTSPLCNNYEQQQLQQQQHTPAAMAVLSAPPAIVPYGGGPSLFARRRVPAPPPCFSPVRDSAAAGAAGAAAPSFWLLPSPRAAGTFGPASPRSPAPSTATSAGSNSSFLVGKISFFSKCLDPPPLLGIKMKMKMKMKPSGARNEWNGVAKPMKGNLLAYFFFARPISRRFTLFKQNKKRFIRQHKYVNVLIQCVALCHNLFENAREAKKSKSQFAFMFCKF